MLSTSHKVARSHQPAYVSYCSKTLDLGHHARVRVHTVIATLSQLSYIYCFDALRHEIYPAELFRLSPVNFAGWPSQASQKSLYTNLLSSALASTEIAPHLLFYI